MLVPTCRKLILKMLYFSIYFTYLFRAPHLHRKFQLQDLWSCVWQWQCQKHHLTIHISYFLNTPLTVFLFTPLAIHKRPSRTEKDQCLLSDVLVYQLALSFPVHFSQWGIDNLYMIFPYCVKERVTKTDIFQLLSKDA